MSRSDSDIFESVDNPNADAFVNIVESGQIGYRLAEEIRQLREALLTVKQEKRILLINNENLENSLDHANRSISSLKSKVADLQHLTQVYSTDLSKKDKDLSHVEEGYKELKKQLSVEKKKNKLLAVELERSLEDEVALRSYSKRLEADNIALKEKVNTLEEVHKTETDERLRCQQFIDTALRSQLILQKKLETVVYYCDKDVDMSAVSILDVSPDYLESLLRDVRSEVSAAGAPGSHAGSSSVGFRGKFDFAVLEHKQHNIDHQGNQYLNNIRSHVSKLRKAQGKTRKYMRSLLDVIHTYEDMPSVAAGAQQVLTKHSVEDEDWSEQCHLGRTGTRCSNTRGSSRSNSNSRDISRDISPDALREREDSHSHSQNHGRDSRERGASCEDFTHERTLVLLEQIQASLRRDQHQQARVKA